ncbi:uncharacterized protein LOC110625171 [Manihot esculenta]|uniref:Small ribosomal subunit protein bS18c n=1 Tax=Manihot esculenta TaxID=3983 RepID=A0A2C9V535_MANES|nr:uncharacterized protein LOC110625171 [Manihot esculenta]OAY39582.1 hypothetical protein MANES_10G106300v8 [Manihot esculenta]
MIRIGGVSLRSISIRSSVRRLTPHFAKPLSTTATSGDLIDDKESPKSFESRDDFEQRIFGGISGSSSASESFFQKLDRLSKARNFTNSGPDKRYGSEVWNDLDGEEEYDGKGDAEGMDDFDDMDEYDEMDESFDSLSDGMDEKLKKAATYYKVDPEEMEEEDYEYRPDMRFPIGSTYDIKDLDLRKPGVSKAVRRREFEVTTEEVLAQADFRNVSFLANFITEAGIIIKRSQTGISAKAQRKVAREIKTARAFGLMPFTTMGTKSFVFGKSMEHLDQDFEYESFSGPMEDDDDVNPRRA